MMSIQETTDEAYVNCLRASEILNVSVSTVKRMCDQQLLDCARTSGGHRRISMQSISRWMTLQKSQADSLTSGFCTSSMDVGSTLNLLLSDTPGQLAAFIAYLRAEGVGIVEIVDTLLLGALAYCKKLCGDEQAPRFQVHQCAAAVRTVLGYLHLNHHPLEERAPVAVGACVGPAKDDLVSGAVAVSLESVGCRSLSLGARVSVEDLAEAADSYRANVVWMNGSNVADVDEMVEMSARLSEKLHPSCLVVLTGCSRWDINRRRLQCDFSADTMRELSRFVAERLRPKSSAVDSAGNSDAFAA